MMSLITVAAADSIILSNTLNLGNEDVPLMHAMGRILAADIVADRDMPPFDRVTMDGIAISYEAFEAGKRTFFIKATMAAGDEPVFVDSSEQCIEIMTGCVLPSGLDTVVRYEDVIIEGDYATITAQHTKQGANIHYKGTDVKRLEVVVAKNTIVDAVTVSIAASVGLAIIKVKKTPKVVVISTGDELVDILQTPTTYQIRRSNSYAIKAVLIQHGIEADLLHLNDDEETINAAMLTCVAAFDVLIVSGGVSMGKFDFVPQALEKAGLEKLFHKILQKPGKPFWFGSKSDRKVVAFAFPGNPVSAFLCLHRYFLPWLSSSISVSKTVFSYAELAQDVSFLPQLQYFMQVSVSVNQYGQLIATPIEGNGSGDFSNLTVSNAFMELPADKNHFFKGEVYKIIPFKTIYAHE